MGNFYCIECGVELKKQGNHWIKHCTEQIKVQDFCKKASKAGKMNRGKTRTDEQKEHYRQSKLGEKNPHFGIPTSQRQKEAVAKARKRKHREMVTSDGKV